MSLFDTGIRPALDAHLLKLAQEKRDYGEYWSASSAGYCMRKNIFERLGVPHVSEDARKQRVFSSGHIFHEWVQKLTRASKISIAQEIELQDEDLMIRGHFDDLVLVSDPGLEAIGHPTQNLILYDYKTVNSRSFTYSKGSDISYYHKMQLGTYMYMLRNNSHNLGVDDKPRVKIGNQYLDTVSEARILKISKDDLRMEEQQLMWSDELAKEVMDYWMELNDYWINKKMPPCTCADHENGFMAKDKWNPYYFGGEPCSLKYYEQWKAQKEE